MQSENNCTFIVNILIYHGFFIKIPLWHNPEFAPEA